MTHWSRSRYQLSTELSWLKECVRTALAQSYQNFEVVVSDNASTDETAEVLSTN